MTKSESKHVFVVIKEPSGTAIYDISQGAGSFQVGDKIYYYTKKVTVNYNHQRGNIASVNYQKGSEYLSGTHTVELFAEGHLIGKTAFSIK